MPIPPPITLINSSRVLPEAPFDAIASASMTESGDTSVFFPSSRPARSSPNANSVYAAENISSVSLTMYTIGSGDTGADDSVPRSDSDAVSGVTVSVGTPPGTSGCVFSEAAPLDPGRTSVTFGALCRAPRTASSTAAPSSTTAMQRLAARTARCLFFFFSLYSSKRLNISASNSPLLFLIKTDFPPPKAYRAALFLPA